MFKVCYKHFSYINCYDLPLVDGVTGVDDVVMNEMTFTNVS